jgi:hypothetical protein
LFGFVEGADIGGQGQREFVVDSTLRGGRSAGTFADTASELEFKYTAFQNFRISAAASLAYYDVAGVAGIEDARHAAMQSMSVDARFAVLNRAQAPFGLTLSVSPHWGFVDETSGVPAGHYGTEIELLADRELAPDRLVAAINLLFANDRTRSIASDGLEHESLIGAGAALAAQIMPNLWLGGETRYLRDYGRFRTQCFRRSGALHRPNRLCAARRKRLRVGGVEFSDLGFAPAAAGALDLANFERHQVKLRFGFEF